MIKGMHGLFYSTEPEALRVFCRDKLGLKATDAGGGWLIFDVPKAEFGVHPTEGNSTPAGTTHISFFCDDLRGTIAELKKRGVEFTQGVQDQGWGLVTELKAPGGVKVQLYEPKYRK